jgi:hypothetical protein
MNDSKDVAPAHCTNMHSADTVAMIVASNGSLGGMAA